MTYLRTNDQGGGHQAVEADVPQATEASGIMAAQWTDFCRRLEKAGHQLLGQEGVQHPLYQAETMRWFMRELQAAIGWEVDAADPDFPHFFIADATASGPVTAPNQDNTYYWARVTGSNSYRIVIDTKCIFDVLINVTDEKWTNYGDHALEEYTVRDDGLLEIILSPEPQPGNWLQLPATGTMLGLRVYYYDWTHDRAPVVTIERIGSELQRPKPVDPATMASRIDATAFWLETRPFQYPMFQTKAIDRFPPNSAPELLAFPGGGGPIQYGCGRYVLTDDEALLIECDVPNARYWSFHVYTVPWAAQIDVNNRLTSLNGTQARVDSDNKVRIVISNRDPGVQNWLDAGDLPTGQFFFRWIWSEDSPQPSTKVVPVKNVREHLPADTPVFTREQRIEQIKMRRLHLASRFRY